MSYDHRTALYCGWSVDSRILDFEKDNNTGCYGFNFCKLVM